MHAICAREFAEALVAYRVGWGVRKLRAAKPIFGKGADRIGSLIRTMIESERTHALPDGRTLRATYEGEPTGWLVRVVGDESSSAAARDIHDALTELIDPGEGLWPDWFIEAAADLAARDTSLGRRYPCPCCGYFTLPEAPTGTYEICEVCFWEDDGIQFNDLDYEGGANKVSLNLARKNFREHSVSELRFAGNVRQPLPEEQP